MSRDDLEQRLAEAERQIDKANRQIEDQAKALKEMQRKIDDAIQTAQQTILTDRQVRENGGIGRAQWAYSRASAESSLSVMQKLGGTSKVYSPSRRVRKTQARQKRNKGFFKQVMGLLR